LSHSAINPLYGIELKLGAPPQPAPLYRSAIAIRCATRMRARHISRLVCTLAAGVAGLTAAPAHARPVLFVGNVDDGTVSLVDSRALKVIGTFDVTPDGKTPQDPVQAMVYPLLVQAKGTNYVQGLAVSPSGRTLYVSRGFLGDVAAFDIATRKLLWRFQIDGIRADHLALSPDGKRLFVSALTSNKVEVLDTATHTLVGSFPTGDWPHVLEFTPDGKYVVNGSLGNQLAPDGVPTRFELTVADPQTLQVVHTFSYDAGVRPFVFSPDGTRAYVQFSYFDGFREINTTTGAVTRTKTLPVMGPEKNMKRSDYPNQAAHHGIDLSGDGTTICDAATVGNYVALVARNTFATEAIIQVGDEPAEAETSADGQYCFVSDRGKATSALSVISYAEQREVARLKMGRRPQEQTQSVVPDTVLQKAGFKLPSAAKQKRARAKHRRR
jgi:DNA-binding beta-propeller fold protein YncE